MKPKEYPMNSRSTVRVFAILSLAATAATATWARESWPAETPEHKKQFETFRKLNDEAWEKAKPVVDEWAKKGKPYLPSAAKPGDLPQAPIPAFPGAEGGGMYTFGGRGGQVYVVTSLADDGSPGTFRAAVEAGGPRIVVFNVAGIIKLSRPLDIRAPYITIAGQTAPGDGVCVAGFSTEINTHDVVIRYMRFRRGATDIYDRNDALGGNPIGNIIIDHCSCSWGLDENISMYRHMLPQGEGKPDLKLPTVNITLQWNISSEALNTYNHAFGGTWGGFNTGFHHNLFADNTGRNASIGMTHDFNWVNNVLFNWRHRTLDGGDEGSLVNCINNYYKPGPITKGALRYRIAQVSGRQASKTDRTLLYGKWYAAGNIVEGFPHVTADNWAGGLQFSDGGAEDAPPTPGAEPATPAPEAEATKHKDVIAKVREEKPFPMPPITIQSAQDAYESVLARAGASLPRRDPVDQRIIEQVRTGKTWGMGQEIPLPLMPGLAKNNAGMAGNGIITDISQVGGYPEYKGEPQTMTQKDGIPDAWKKKYGLDVNDPTLAGKDLDGDGYTTIEEYLNGTDPTQKVDYKDLKNNVSTLTNLAK
jgi:hypothetical protein